jgi:benzodiazapine receptor
MKLQPVAGTSLAVAACAALGGVGTDPESLYYRTLRKPRWQPPKLAFPLVWTSLYADIAVTNGLAIGTLQDSERADEARRLVAALGANLVLNTTWSWLFFRWHRRVLATVECAVLTASSVDLVRRVAAVDRRAGAALAPYAVWCGFATVLSGTIARLNRGR